MVATLGAAQRKNVLTTEIPLINWDYQLLRLKIMLNGEIQSNHIDILQSSTLVVGESRTIDANPFKSYAIEKHFADKDVQSL